MEGVAFHIKKVFLAIKSKGAETRSIEMVGGGSRNEIWAQIVADVLNMEVKVPRNPDEDFAVKGAAIIANLGLDQNLSLYESYSMFESGFDAVRPDKDAVQFYQKKYERFEEHYKKIYG
jgi:xylulokinase